MVTTAGIPVALAKLTAERAAFQAWDKVRSLFQTSLLFLSFSGTLGSLLLWWAAPHLAFNVFADPRVYPTLAVMLLALPIVSLSSGFRGSFQGLQLFQPLALAQLGEQLVRISAGLLLGIHLLPWGIPWAAAGLAGGMVLGELMGMAINIFIWDRARAYYHLGKGKPLAIDLTEFKALSRLSLPVMISRIIGGLMITLEALLIPRRLQEGGWGTEEATALYGQFTRRGPHPDLSAPGYNHGRGHHHHPSCF